MMLYLIKWILCLAVLLVFYHWVLEREKMHQFNRLYLLSSVFIAALIPLIPIYIEPETLSSSLVATTTTVVEGSIANNPITFETVLFTVYILISCLLLFRFLKNLISLLLKARNNVKITMNNATLVLVEDAILPHSFWNYIFVNKEQFNNDEIEEELFTHELTHVTQKHTLDVLFMEMLYIIFWFNPLIFWLKKTIQLNHEFLADEYVISSYNNIPKYQYLLLDKATWNNTYYLASNLNYSLTKKRLLMMKTHNSKRAVILKKIAVLPLLFGLIFVFADRVEAQTKKKEKKLIEVVEVDNTSATRAQMKEYNKLLNAASSKNIYKQKDVEKMKYIYSKMSSKQKESVKNINDILPPKPPKPIRIEVIEKASKKPKKIKEVIKVVEKKAKKAHKHNKVEVIEIEEVHEDDKHINEHEHGDPPAPNFEAFKKEGAKFYINGKKVSSSKAKAYFYELENKVKTLDIIKDKGKTEVRIGL